MRAGTAVPGECVAPRPASAPSARRPGAPGPARLFPAISVSDQDIPSRCQIGGSAAWDCGIYSVSLSCAITMTYTHLTCLRAGVVIPERAYLGASHPAGREPRCPIPVAHFQRSRYLREAPRSRPRSGSPRRRLSGSRCRRARAPSLRRTTIHGETRIDEYHWLRYRDDPEVIAYLEAENRYTERRHAAHRGAAGAALPGDAGPDQGDRSLGPRARSTAGSTTPAPRPAAQYPIFCRRLDRRRFGRGNPAGPEPPGRRARLLPDGRLRGESRPPAAGLLGGHQRRRGVPAGGEGPGDRCAAGRADRELLARPPHGPTTAATLFYIQLD